MPKMKTRKSVAKRFKQTGTGKFLRKKAGKRHILTKKSSKLKHNLSKQVEVSKSDQKRVSRSLPYGLPS
ncbi:MAG: 50S ribosomal protein L35 [Verrucomicrobiota bacterium]|nr:50S ribosomal protein L35 [Verrucomicrobiota bacterium]